MKIAVILAASGFIMTFGGLIFIIGLILSSESNSMGILFSILVIINGFMALGLSEILNKLNEKT
ncbi:hypothetical protein [Savagea faecisuis]|uniref:NADH dehydrogenase subunit 4L n=1 Tax=Savagea faecisuis TaxID=1274803 RepID=A0ABW3H0L4_9BACL